MKKVLFSTLFLAAFAIANAQSGKMVEDSMFKVNALLPGVSYELGVTDKSTINLEANLGLALYGQGGDTEFGIFPGIEADYRIYNNFDRRLAKGKNIKGNSGNYFGLVNQLQFGTPILGDLEYQSNYFYNLAAVYGIQRTQPKGFYWGVSFGPAIFVNELDANVGILINARLGWVIGGRNK